MRKLLILAALFFSVNSFAQIESAPPPPGAGIDDDTSFYAKYPYTYGIKHNRVYARKALRAPKDTIYTKSGLAIMDTILWYGDEVKWRRSGDATSGASGTVTSFSSGDLSPIFTTIVTGATTTPALSFTLSNAAGGTVFGNRTGSAGSPAYTSVPVLGIPGTITGTLGLAGVTSGTVTISPQDAAGTWTLKLPNNDGDTLQFLQTNGLGVTRWTLIDTTNIANFFTKVRSLFSAGTGLSYANGVYTNTGDLSTSNELQTIAVSGTTTGITTLSDGGGTMTIAGAGINTVGVSGSTITITGTEVGTVASVGLALPSEFTISNSPVTSTGTLTGAWANQSAFTVFRRASGAGVPSFGTIDTTYIADFWSKTRSLFSAGTGLSYANGTFTNTGDLSTSNELQTITNSSDATSHTVTLSNSGGSTQFIEGTGITLTTGGSGSAGTVTIASTDAGRFGVSGEDATATQTRAFNKGTNPFSISGTDGVGLTKLEMGVTEGEVRIQARNSALSGANEGTFINMDGSVMVLSAYTSLTDEASDITLEDGTGAEIKSYSSANNTWQSQINVRKDSITIFPNSGRLNIDSLRAWTAIADSSYKRLMTWDERNGRWEYFDGYFPTSSTEILTSQNNGGDFQVDLSSGGYFKLVAGTGIGLTIDMSGGSSAGVATFSNTGLVDVTATDGSGFDFTITGTTTKNIALTTTLTAGSVFFAGAAGAINEDNTNLFFDDGNNFLGVGLNNPGYRLDVYGSVAGNQIGNFYNANSSTGQGVFIKVNHDDDYDVLNLQSSVATVFNVQANGAVAFNGDYGTAGYYLKTLGTGLAPEWTALPDGSATNELQTISTSGTTSPTVTLSNSGGSFTITGAGIASLSRSGDTFTVTATEVDGSITNEIQTFTSTSDATSFTWTLASGGSLKLIEGDGIDFTVGGTSADPEVTITAHAH